MTQEVWTYLTDEDWTKFKAKAKSLELRPNQLMFLLLSKTLGYDTSDRAGLLLDWEIATREEGLATKSLGVGDSIRDKLIRELSRKSPQSTSTLNEALGRKDNMVYRTLWENSQYFASVPEPEGTPRKKARGRRPRWWRLVEGIKVSH